MSEHRYSSLRDWLALAMLGFTVGFFIALPLYRNLQQSALAGLVAVPSLFVGVSCLTRQRERLLSRQLMQIKSQLRKSQQQERVLRKNWQLLEQAHQAKVPQVQQLAPGQKNLSQNIQFYENQIHAVEQQLTSRQLRLRQQNNLTTELDQDIQQKRNQLEQLDTTIITRQNYLDGLKLEFNQLQREQRAKQQSSKVDEVELANIQKHIDQCITIQSELESRIETLNSSLQNIQREISQKTVTTQTLEAHLYQLRQQQTDRSKTVTHLDEKISKKEALIQGRELTYQHLEQQIEHLQADHAHLSGLVAAMNESIAQKQALFLEIDHTLSEHQSIKKRCMHEINQLQTSIHDLKFQLSGYQLQLNSAQTQFQPGRSEIVQPENDFDSLDEKWYSSFQDNPHLTILSHIEKHGAITEAEASSLLGNPRSVRQFANRLSEYSQHLPFSIRVEPSSQGNRYLKQSPH